MNDSEPSNQSSQQPDAVKLQCECLQKQVATLLIALVILSGILTIFLFRQMTYAQRDLNSVKPAGAQIIQDFNQNKANLETFVAKIAEYGRAHPDFAPIVNRYRSILAPTSAAPAGAATPAPAATPKPAPAPASAPKK